MAALLAGVVPLTAAINGYMRLHLDSKQQTHEIQMSYLDRAIDPAKTVEYKESILTFLVATSQRTPLRAWAENQLRNVKRIYPIEIDLASKEEELRLVTDDLEQERRLLGEIKNLRDQIRGAKIRAMVHPDPVEATTRHIGAFPENMDAIIDVIASAKHELIIGTDVAAYGAFSDPVRHREYKENLVRASRVGVQVNMRVDKAELARERLAQQLPRDSYAFRKYFKIYSPEPDNSRELYDALLAHEQQLQEELLNIGVTVFLSDTPNQLSYWIADMRVAVFSQGSVGHGVGELTFRTTDPSVIRFLANVDRETRYHSRPAQTR